MDAYDIFKKLTKGLTFKNKPIGVKNNNQTTKPPIKKEIEIKKEEISDHEQDEKTEIEMESDHESDTTDQESASSGSEEEGRDIQLVKGMTIGEKQKKKKKKKKERTEDLLKKLEIEEHNRFRNEHGIKTVGRHVPAALKDFTDLSARYNVSQALVDVVLQCGYDEPTPIQRQAMPCMLEDRQILACAPTGSGKTAAFLIPILHALGAPQGGPRALVLCPTRELAHQIYREALRLTAASELRCSVVKNMKLSKVKEREATIRKSDIVISTPNRLCYLLNQDKVNISFEKVHWLIIDEADKLFEGSVEDQSDFRQQLEQVLNACSGKQRRVALYSATHTPPLAQWCRRRLRGLVNVTVGQRYTVNVDKSTVAVGHRNAASSLVEQELLYCGDESGKLVAFRQLVQKGLQPPVLVFVQSKERAKQLFKELIYDGINVDAIHADRTQLQRDNVVRSFRVGRVWVLICTELAGRGLDFRGVNLVLNYDFPPSAIAYIHRVGRAGRAGQKGKAITFFTQDDVVNLRSIASVIKQSGCEVPEYMLALKQDANRRKKRTCKAPARSDISTVVKKPDKRKLDAPSINNTEKAKGTDSVKSGKNKKQRKTQNGGRVEENKKNFAKKTSKHNKNKNNPEKNKGNKNSHVISKKKNNNVRKTEFSKKKKTFVKKSKPSK